MSQRLARDVPDLELADYQRAVRLVLRHPLITASHPDDRALARVRRFAATLREDLAESFGYRLELHGNTARLVRTHDRLDPDQPALTGTRRPFDRQRYAYLALCLAVLGRAGVQITLSELAAAVASDANRITGLGLDPDRGADRRAFVDAVAWLEERGALRVADGSRDSWASDPGFGEALYDVARDVVFAAFRPGRLLQHLDSVTALLGRSTARSGNAAHREAAQAARRAVVERPVVYFSEMPQEIVNHLRGPALAADLRRLTGLELERRAEGVLLVDTVNFSTERFPGAGSVAQAAVLLLVEMADQVVDPDGQVRRLTPPDPAVAYGALAALVDAGLPTPTMLVAADPAEEPSAVVADGGDVPGPLPLITDTVLRTAIEELLRRYGNAFGKDWHADPDRLRSEALALLERFGIVIAVPGGVLVRPLAGRYRNTVATVKKRAAQPATMF